MTDEMKLPICRHRGEELAPLRWRCLHPGVVAPGGVSVEICAACAAGGYFCDRDPEPHQVAARSAFEARKPDIPPSSLSPDAPGSLASPGDDFACVHRGQVWRVADCGCGERDSKMEIYQCAAHGECTIHSPGKIIPKSAGNGRVRCCIRCEDRRLPDGTLWARQAPLQPISPKTDPPYPAEVVDAAGRPADILHNVFRGSAAFLICGGPSLAEAPLDLLYQPGLLLAAVNNAATIVRPHVWFAVDEPRSFSDAIFRDPAILKFQKRRYANGHFRTLNPSGPSDQPDWQDSGIETRAMPATFFFEWESDWNAANFLTRSKPTWGNEEARSVMLIALRLLIWMGVRRIFLIGADFHMRPERQYAFDERRDEPSCDSNNETYRVLDRWFAELRPHLEAAGIDIYNCTPGSHLTAFEFVSLERALESALENFPIEIETRGLYTT